MTKAAHVIVIGRGVYALPLLRILGTPSSKNHLCITLATSVGRQDLGSVSCCVDHVIKTPRPDRDLEGFTDSICEASKGKGDVTIVPVGEETLYLSQPQVIYRIKQACDPFKPRILTSSHTTLTQLSDKFCIQQLMSEIFGNDNIPYTSLVHDDKALIKAVQQCFQHNPRAPYVVLKPLAGRGSQGNHMIGSTEFSALAENPNDLFCRYPIQIQDSDEAEKDCKQLATPYVVQEFVEGHEYSTFSLCLNGKVAAHVCYKPRNVGDHGFSPIRDEIPRNQKLWRKTLDFVQRIAIDQNLTGHVGFDIMQRFNGELVALECNPRVTNGIAFLSPRLSTEVANQMQELYIGSWSSQDNHVLTNVVAPDNSIHSRKVPRQIMSALPTLSVVLKAKTTSERMALLESVAVSYDDIWWWKDPLPFAIMIGRVVFTILCGIAHRIFPYLLSVPTISGSKRLKVSDYVKQSVMNEIICFDQPAEASLQHEETQSVGGIVNAAIKKKEERGLRVLVTGSTGFLGGRIVRALNQGWDDKSLSLPESVKSVVAVTATGRNYNKGQKLLESLDRSTGKDIQFVPADLDDPEEAYNVIRGHDVVIHAAALTAAFASYDDYYSANVTAVENIAHACYLNGVKLLVHISSPSVCVAVDDTDRIGVKETDPLPPDDRQANRYSASKAMAEAVVADVASRYDLPCIMLRPRAIFGPGDTTLFPLLLDRLKSGKLAAIGNGKKSEGDFTYVDNVVAACLCCLDKAPEHVKVYAITNDDPRRLWDIIEKICNRLELKRPTKRISRTIAYKLATVLEAVSALAMLVGKKKEPLFTRYSVNVVSLSSTFDISAAKHDLGYKPIVPFDVGVERFLESITPKTTESSYQ